MKTSFASIGRLVAAIIISLGLNSNSRAQQLQFTDVRVTSGGAIQLYWASDSNAVYNIEFAPELTDGGTVWKTIYEDYPALGTNTFWTDAGDQNTASVVNHPRDGAMRFYRVVQPGTNNLASAAQASIVSPTNNAVLTGDVQVSVTVTSSITVNTIRLFVDGQEVGYQNDTETNFVINTCQFGNGTHKIYAVVENSSGSETTSESSDFVPNYGVSPVRTVTFDNFITDYRGKLRFQDPDESETNRFSASFAAYADWTLTITNQDGIAVRTETGTGFGMEFVWDGTGDGGTNLPSGPYWAVLSATESSSSSLASLLQKMPTFIEDAIVKGEKSYFIESPPMPPIFTNGEWVAWEKVFGPLPSVEVPIRDEYFALAAEIESEAKSLTSKGGGVVLNAAGDSGSGSQTTVLRPVPSVWFGKNGTVGIAYQGNHPEGTSFGSNTRPTDGLGGRVSLNVTPGSYPKLRAAHRIALGFNRYMGDAGYRLKFYKGNFDLTASDLRKPSKGGDSRFNEVNVGLLIGHGVCSADSSSGHDFTISASGPFQSYYPVWEGGSGYNWVRLSEFDFGSSGVNGLRWMSILSCNNLIDHVYQDCYDKEALPVNDDLHLLCGAKSAVFIVSNFGLKYSAALTGRGGVTRKTVAESWFYAGAQSQGIQPGGPHLTVHFRVIGWPNCFNDDLIDFQSPNSGNPADITYQDSEVFTP
jgi:hypothetical protein